MLGIKDFHALYSTDHGGVLEEDWTIMLAPGQKLKDEDEASGVCFRLIACYSCRWTASSP